jgi:light-regulated signal transduction histidine kinase (bacteriophytochrome)
MRLLSIIQNQVNLLLNNVGNSLEQAVNHLNQVLHIKSQNHKSSSHLLAKSIQYAINSLKNDIQKTQASIICDFPENFEITGIEAYLDSICLNLISDAIKYKQPNSAPEIIISATHKNNSTHISFTHNGLGMNLKKVTGKLFGMYKTFHKNSNAEGVGLFIVKNQMNTMHGTIEVESQPNVGSKFILSFNM